MRGEGKGEVNGCAFPGMVWGGRQEEEKDRAVVRRYAFAMGLHSVFRLRFRASDGSDGSM